MFIFAAEEPNSWMLPGDVNEVYWGTAAFLVVLGLYLWKGLEPTKQAMRRRSDRIAGEIEEAEAARDAAQAELERIQSGLSNVDVEASAIVDDARGRVDTVRADLMARAEAEVEDVKSRARLEIDAQKSQALADLRAEVAARAAAATEAVVHDQLDETAQRELIERYIDEVGAAT